MSQDVQSWLSVNLFQKYATLAEIQAAGGHREWLFNIRFQYVDIKD